MIKKLIALITAYIVPILTGMVWGIERISYYLLTLVLLLSIMLIWNKNKIIHLLTIQCIVFLFLLSTIDVVLNIYNQLQQKKESLFTETSIPLVKKYKPNETITIHYADCLSEVLLTKNLKEKCTANFTFRITTDSLGYRNNSHTQDSVDAILIGDSFGLGKADQEKTISEILYNKYQINTYNLSISGNGPWEQNLILREELNNIPLRKKGKIIWLLFSGNDLEGNYGPLKNIDTLNTITEKAQRMRDTYYAFRKQAPIRNYFQNIFKKARKDSLREKVVLKQLTAGENMAFYEDYITQIEKWHCCTCPFETHRNYSAFLKNVKYFAAFARERKIELYTLLVPTKLEVYHWAITDNGSTNSCLSPMSTSIETIMQEDTTTNYFDLKPHLILQSQRYYAQEKEFIYWQFDPHLNHLGNEVVSDFIFNIEQKKPL